ncbi:MAG: ATP-binding protein [Phototrophicaceae bacterium]
MDSQNHYEKEQLLQRYERIIEISQRLNTTYNLRSLLETIISAAKELTDTQAASIMLIDSAGELRFEYASNIKAHEMERITIPMEGSIAGWIATHGEPRVINDVTQEPEHFNQVDDEIAFKTRSILGVPMRAHNKVIGVLEAINKLSDGSFRDEDIGILATLASQAAIAIENARLFQQSDFIAEMVHEIRTPLAALKASSVLLQRDDLPKDRMKDIVYTMQSETERLIRMTTEFLDLARLESGRFQLEKAPFAIEDLIRESMDVVIHQSREKAIRLVLSADANYMVNGDRGKLKQVILNLLTNAIKYNRPGGAVTIFVTPSLQYSDFVEIAVEDTGFGITQDNLKNLFQKFFRVADTAGHTQGTGLGLAITRHIVEAHGGKIWVVSEHGIGSTFYVTLPRS